MNQTIIEIHARKPEFDPLAKQVRAELIESGEKPADSVVQTQRLYKIEGSLDLEAAKSVAHTLLVDPVIETVVIDHPLTQNPVKKSAKKKKAGGYVLDVWPKAGVTDPVGETVEKGLGDLGFKGKYHAASAIRYVFPKIKSARAIENLARKSLANELIHDIRIREI